MSPLHQCRHAHGLGGDQSQRRNLDTGESPSCVHLKGEEITKAGIGDPELGPVKPDSEIVVSASAAEGRPVDPAPADEQKTYTDPSRYGLVGDGLVFDRTFGRAANAVVLPKELDADQLQLPGNRQPHRRQPRPAPTSTTRPDEVEALFTARRWARPSHQSPRRLCQSSIESRGVRSKVASSGPTPRLDQDGLNLSIRCTRDGGTGNSLSIAEAKGCTSSGHSGENSQSAVAQAEHKLRSPVETSQPPSSSRISARKTRIARRERFPRSSGFRRPRGCDQRSPATRGLAADRAVARAGRAAPCGSGS